MSEPAFWLILSLTVGIWVNLALTFVNSRRWRKQVEGLKRENDSLRIGYARLTGIWRGE